MKPINLQRFKRNTPPSIPPVGEVDLKFDPDTDTFVQVNADGTTSELGGGGAADTGLATVREIEEASYTLIASDTGKVLVFTNSNLITVNVPVSLPAGFNCAIVTGSVAGTLTLDPELGAVFNGSAGNYELPDPFGCASLLHLNGTGSYLLKGDATAV